MADHPPENENELPPEDNAVVGVFLALALIVLVFAFMIALIG